MANMNEQEVAVKLTEVEARCKSNTHRLDNVEKRQNALDKLAESIGRMDEHQNALDTDIKEIKADVKTITQKPSNGGTGSLTRRCGC